MVETEFKKYFEEGGMYEEDGGDVEDEGNKYKTSREKIRTLGKFIYDIDHAEGMTLDELSRETRKCIQRDKDNHINCAGTAYNSHVNMVSSVLEETPLREYLYEGLDEVGGVINSKYSIASKPYGGKRGYKHNYSLDSWEAAQKLIDDGHKVIFDSSKQDIGEIDFKNIPIGSVVYTGDAMGIYTEGSNPRHTMTVIGYDKEGIPLISDLGEARRITNPKLYEIEGFKYIITPKGYEKYTFDNINSDLKLWEKELGYSGDYELEPIGSDYEEVKKAEEFVNSKAKEIGKFYDIPKSTIEKIKDRALAVGIKESDFNNSISDEDLEKLGMDTSIKSELRDTYTDVFRGNMAGQGFVSVAKAALNIFKLPDIISQRIYESMTGDKIIDLPEYKLQLEIYKELEKAGVDKPEINDMTDEIFNKINKMRYRKKHLSNLTPSAGAFSIKYLPKYAKENDLSKNYVIMGDKQEELNKGLEVAMAVIAESYTNLKKKHKDLSDEELLDLATVDYSNKTKVEDRDFIEYSIKSDKIEDISLSKIKRYEKWLKTGKVN